MAKRSDSIGVYRTDGGRLCPQCQRLVVACICGADRPAATGDGVVRIRRETKGRAGKAVTVIDGIPVDPAELKNLCKHLKQRCGVGGAVKGVQLEIQGDQRTMCQKTLEEMGYVVKQSGG